MRHIAYFGSKMEPLISAQSDAIAEAGVRKLHVPVSGLPILLQYHRAIRITEWARGAVNGKGGVSSDLVGGITALAHTQVDYLLPSFGSNRHTNSTCMQPNRLLLLSNQNAYTGPTIMP
jgi:hypothetical protein